MYFIGFFFDKYEYTRIGEDMTIKDIINLTLKIIYARTYEIINTFIMNIKAKAKIKIVFFDFGLNIGFISDQASVGINTKKPRIPEPTSGSIIRRLTE